MKTIAKIAETRVDAGARSLSGIATHPSQDRMGDCIESAGIRSAAGGVPLLLHHDSRLPVGRAKLGKATRDGTPFVAILPAIATAGALRDRVTEAWDSVASGIISNVSIGFRPIEFELMQSGGIRFAEIEVLELSLVAVSCHPRATITANKAERDLILRRLGSTGARGLDSRLDPAVVAARRARLLREARQDERARINLQYFWSLE